jgi:hypothetical protein
MARFALLEHTNAPDDPAGRHFDLLLEAGDSCRTWRLASVPVPGGPAVPASEVAPHRLDWLDHVDGEVSGGRGSASRVDAGTFSVLEASTDDIALAQQITVLFRGDRLIGAVRLCGHGSSWEAVFPAFHR